MSATTQSLLEQIEKCESEIQTAVKAGQDVKLMREELQALKSRFFTASQTLNENRQILKGL